MNENCLRENLQAREEEYLKNNPNASKNEAFEHAKTEIELSAKQPTDGIDAWSGLDYDYSA